MKDTEVVGGMVVGKVKVVVSGGSGGKGGDKGKGKSLGGKGGKKK
jgi:hypothetical protein